MNSDPRSSSQQLHHNGAMIATESYNDSHRLFLQSMLSNRILKEQEAIQIYYQICQLTDVEAIDFDEFVATINGEINEIDLALRRSRKEADGTPIIALVNTREDEVAQTATNYTPAEITYLRQLLEMMIMADDEAFGVGTMAALRLGPKMKPPISQKDAQDFLDRLMEDGWLDTSPDGSSYIAAPRCILELQTYLKEQYPDMMKSCKVCLEVITMGERCELQDCQTRIHRHCADGLFGYTSDENRKCPVCSTLWSRDNTFGIGLPL
ncbi:Nse1 non-SMC component of SMC5-6 complex-domain-containing protein [Dichotomocladium elegans]|nr:Nse1 non-SMC component of SMC5-6 complex-domain-containing protein [Dichotomocladium elegans]